MLKIHKKVEYALFSLKYILESNQALDKVSGKTGSLVSAKDISEHYSLPFDATSRVLQVLASNKWLKSEQGAAGGYGLGSKNIEELNLLELIEMIEGPQGLVKCLIRQSECPINKKCNIATPLGKLNDLLKDFLSQQKVYDLIGPNHDISKLNDMGESSNLSKLSSLNSETQHVQQ